MGSSASAPLSAEDARTISEETGFTPRELQRLCLRFQELDKRHPPEGFITREDLLEIHGVALNPLGERLVDVILEDYGDGTKLNFRQFVNVFAQFRRGQARASLSSKEKKLSFLFSIYDRNHDCKIDREELLEILKMMVGGGVHENDIRTIADHTIGELDADGDLTITFEEFCETLKNIDVDDKMTMKFLR